MLKKYTRLKATMIEHDIDEHQMEKIMMRSPAYISKKMDGKAPWKLDDIYQICDILHIPYDEIHLYFPK